MCQSTNFALPRENPLQGPNAYITTTKFHDNLSFVNLKSLWNPKVSLDELIKAHHKHVPLHESVQFQSSLWSP